MATVPLSVFGLGSQVDITSETLALAGLVGFTVLFEMAAHRLEHRLEGTPYMGMLAKIYKELMIMGFISLGVFLTLQFGSVGSSVGFYTFEFAHIVIFCTTLMFVMQACLMMVLSSQLKRRYEKSTNISVDHLLTFYSLHRKSKVFHARWLPTSDLREVMEFKIVYFFFRTTFALPTTFNFALYMRQATDSHILALVDVESSTWVILAALIFLNLARIKIWQQIAATEEVEDHRTTDDHSTTDDHTSSAHDDDHRRRWLAGVGGDDGAGSYSNTGSDGELMFIVAGWLMLTLAAANYFMSRWVELRLLKKAGCEGTHEYHTRLAVIEKQTLEAKREENERRTVVNGGGHLEWLKRQVDKAKENGKGHHRRHHHRHHHHQHRLKKGDGQEDETDLHRSISRHLGQAKHHAQALYTRVGSGDLHKIAKNAIVRSSSSPSGTFFSRGGNGSKVVPGASGGSAQSSPGYQGLRAAAGEAIGTTTTPRLGRNGDTETSQSSTLTHAGGVTRDAPITATYEPGEGVSAGGQTGCLTQSGPGSKAPDEVRTFRLSDYGLERELDSDTSLADDGCRHSRYLKERSNDTFVEVEDERRLESDGGGDQGSLGGFGDGWVAAAASENNIQEDQFAVSHPSLLAPLDDGAGDRDSGDAFELSSPMQLVVKPGPSPLLEQKTVTVLDRCRERRGSGGRGGGSRVGGAEEANSDDNDDDDDETSCSSSSRRESRSFSQASTVGRRASVGIRRQARRVSRRVSQTAVWVHTTKLATDVTNVAGRFIRVVPEAPKLELVNDLSDIYPLSNPAIFHKTLDALLLLSCMYLALWAVNFMSIANEKTLAFLRHIAMLLPAAGAFLFNALSVKTSSLLLAITAMDPEIIGKVVDQQIDEEKLVSQFRERLTGRLEELGLGQRGLASAFEEVDVAGRGELTIKELSHVMFTLNFHASKDVYRKLFNVMDKNRKGVVSFHQLCELVYDREAAAQEATALGMKGKMHAIK